MQNIDDSYDTDFFYNCKLLIFLSYELEYLSDASFVSVRIKFRGILNNARNPWRI